MYFSNLNYCIMMFDLIGVHPEKGYTFKQIFWYLFTLVFWQLTVIYLAILYIVYKEDITIEDVTSSLETFFMTFHGVIKLNLLFYKRKNVRDLLHRMKHFWRADEVENAVERKEHLNQLKFLKRVFIIYNFICICTTISFTCKTFFMEGDYLTFTTYKPEWIPFYALLFYEGIAFVYGVYLPVPGIDMFIVTTFILTKIQFKMLNEEIGRIFSEGSGPNIVDVNTRLKKCADHHVFLLDYVNRINTTFSTGMLGYVAIIVLSMCVEMYIVLSTQTSIVSFIKGAMYIANGLIQYILCYCIPAQAITDEADRTANYTYFNNWHEHLTPSMKTAQIMIISRAQKKTLILAGGFIKVDLEACLKVSRHTSEATILLFPNPNRGRIKARHWRLVPHSNNCIWEKTIKTMVSYAMFIRTIGIRGK
ncbi:hypothetical protein NQ315_000061 [Exocentrus adspersus]|uniref:Odorant receptor n=1 Tax=Exocentrus adspersus TaxID=1586481 RepID=A0AAV8VTC9_9CUCU|nr:hypothetical protein NQ315_000061 [Exocentrus adspersus]